MTDSKDGHWMEKAFANSKGQLRKSTGTKSGQKISSRKLRSAENSRSPKTRKRAQLAETVRKINLRRGR